MNRNLVGNIYEFRFIWPSGFRGEDFKKSANQKQKLPMAAMFVNGSAQNEQSLDILFYSNHSNIKFTLLSCAYHGIYF
jgi:hypothetical protein